MPRTRRKPFNPFDVPPDPDLTRPIRDLVAEVTTDPDGWLNTPNSQFSMARPADLVGTNQERHVRDLLRAVKAGFFS